MKKLIIGVVVILAAALIGLKYFAAKKQAVETSPPPGISVEQQGVALPAGAKDYAAPDSMSSYSPPQATGSFELLALPAAALDLKGACDGGSPKEIMENHGKTWGYFTGRNLAFEPLKTQDIYNHVWDYYACTAASRQDSTICSELPGENVKDAVKFGVPMYNPLREGMKPGTLMTPMGQCRSKTVEFLFKAYAAGKVNDRQNCIEYMSETGSDFQAKISPAEFCALNPEKGLALIKERMPDIYPMAEKTMAISKKACGFNAECLANNALWEGLTTGNPAKCPDAYKLSCAALAQRSPAPCAAILADMSKKYCAYLKELLKKSGGYAGVTPEDVKKALAEEARKKAEEELLRKQAEATMKQINENVRKQMGKKGE